MSFDPDFDVDAFIEQSDGGAVIDPMADRANTGYCDVAGDTILLSEASRRYNASGSLCYKCRLHKACETLANASRTMPGHRR